MKNVRRHMIAFRGVTGAAAGDNIMAHYIFVLAQYLGNARSFYIKRIDNITLISLLFCLHVEAMQEGG